MFWVKVTLNDCFFSNILLSYSRILFRVHSISLFGLSSWRNVPIIQRLLIFISFLMFSLGCGFSTHFFVSLSLRLTNQRCLGNVQKRADRRTQSEPSI